MLESKLPAIEKLATLVQWTSTSAVSRETGLDRTNIRDYLSWKRNIGPTTSMKIERAYSKELGRRYGVPSIVFPSPISDWLQELRNADAHPEKKAVIREIYYSDKLGALAHGILRTPGPDQKTTVRFAMVNLVKGHVNGRAASVLTHQGAEKRERMFAAMMAPDQFAASADLFCHAKENPGTDPQWTTPELQGFISYARLGEIGYLSEYRKSRRRFNGGFAAFSDDLVKQRIRKTLPDFRDVLCLYKEGHPDHLRVAANITCVGSEAEDEDLALRGWQAMADAHPPAADLRYQLPGYDRPLADSSQTKWLRDRFGFILPSTSRESTAQ